MLPNFGPTCKFWAMSASSNLVKNRIVGSTSGIHLDILRALGLRPPRSRMSVEVGGPDSTLV